MTQVEVRPLYHSPRGLYDFQAQGVGRCVVYPDNLAVWDTGLGKTHLAMATSAILFEDGLIDHVIVIAEGGKVRDWVEDYGRFTDLTVALYHGTLARRKKLRANMPQVLITTYETARNDCARKGRSKSADWLPDVLTDDLMGLRVLVVYDECSRLRTRTAGTYKAQECFVKHLRARGETRTMGLTATPIERDPEDVFDAGRIITPNTVGTVGDFYKHHVLSRDIFDKPVKFKNIGFNDDVIEPGVPLLRDKLSPALFVKSKFDEDVKGQFPKQIEEVEFIPLGARHLEFYEAIRRAFYEMDPTPQEERMLFGVMRQIAGHPLSLLRSEGKLAKAIVEQVGASGLEALGCAKLDWLLGYLNTVVKGQGAKAIVFTFYGQSILPLIHERLRMAEYNVVVNHGGMTTGQRQESIHALRYGDAEIFLSSDAGSKGLNLPEAHYVVNYELPLTYANYRQRNDRVHRIDSLAEIVVTQSIIAENTVEEPIANGVIRRNQWHDTLLADDDEFGDHLDATARKELIAFAKKRVKAA